MLLGTWEVSLKVAGMEQLLSGPLDRRVLVRSFVPLRSVRRFLIFLIVVCIFFSVLFGRRKIATGIVSFISIFVIIILLVCLCAVLIVILLAAGLALNC